MSVSALRPSFFDADTVRGDLSALIQASRGCERATEELSFAELEAILADQASENIALEIAEVLREEPAEDRTPEIRARYQLLKKLTEESREEAPVLSPRTRSVAEERTPLMTALMGLVVWILLATSLALQFI